MRNPHLVALIVLAAIVLYAGRIVLLAIGSALYVYLWPGLIAQKKGRPDAREYFLACALGGWLVIPWLIALGYALAAPKLDREMPALPRP
ncbi:MULTISPECIES: superinfection immunity protein [Massilia]|uniref:Superinfection immunity protein n=1 Tax=Massilia haematophila TaxID=457923 RepID=A0ABV7PJX6_9BURK|nr:superinfection immunity protein [Massilia sp.]HBZ06421.1 hypothetical protein [Massilia sp.]